jgi:nicotinate-nucleotide pyrophosphorylase (carboxylating)
MDLHETLISYILEDAPLGDITSERVVPADATCTAVIYMREDGIVAGLEEFSFLARWAGLSVTLDTKDGQPVRKGTIIGSCSGNTRKVLLIERTVLNVIGRMSGIATITSVLSSIVHKKNPDCRIAATRKTAPGSRLIDKKAVFIGGGDPHRSGLSDGILIKDNHLAVTPLEEALRLSCAFSRYRPTEVEVENLEDALVAARSGASIILLDNMRPEDIRATERALVENGLRDRVLLEASGGITPRNIEDYADSGVDLISLGCITHSTPSIDVSMEILPADMV